MEGEQLNEIRNRGPVITAVQSPSVAGNAA